MITESKIKQNKNLKNINTNNNANNNINNNSESNIPDNNNSNPNTGNNNDNTTSENNNNPNTNDNNSKPEQSDNNHLTGTEDNGDESSTNEEDMTSEKNENEQIIELKRQRRKPKKTKYFDSIFPRVRNEKPGAIYYPLFTTILMLIIIYLILFYTNMDRDYTFQATSSSSTQFSGVMVIWVFIYVIFAVIDRIIYIRQSRDKLQFEYKYYHIKTGELVSPDEREEIEQSVYNEFPELQKKKHFEIPLFHIETLEQKYNVVIIQNEPPNYPLIAKFVMNIVITILVHAMVFFFLPMYGNMKLNNSVYCSKTDEFCNDFHKNIWIILFYLLNVLYLFASSLQIKHGYLDMTPKSLIKYDYTAFHANLHTVYKKIPFLYELKLAIDWTFTPTSLDIFQWNTFESVYDLFYATQCGNSEPNEDPVGTPIPKLKKSYLGAPIFIGIIVLLIGPLLLFSNLNPTNELNNITGASIELQISIKEGNLYKNYTLFKNDHVDSLETISDTIWKQYKYNEASSTKNFPREQVQIVRMSDTSDKNWDLALPHINHIIEVLQGYNNTETNEIDLINLRFYYEFTRPSPENNKESIKDIDYFLFDKNKLNETRHSQIANLTNSLLNCVDVNVSLPDFYYPMLKLSSIPHPKVLRDDVFELVDVELSFKCKQSPEMGTEYFNSYFILRKTDFVEDGHDSFEFHTFSDKISDVTSGYSVMTFYITFVLLAGSYVRDFFSGGPEEIILSELPDPSKLVSLCEGIKISRNSFDLEKEEQLYYVLIEFIRSPECLRMLTKSLVNEFKERKNNIKKEEEE